MEFKHNIWESWVPIAKDPLIPNYSETLINAIEKSSAMVNELLQTGRLFGEFSPRFISYKNFSDLLSKYMTIDIWNAVIQIAQIDSSNIDEVKILIRVYETWQPMLKRLWYKYDQKPFIFVPRIAPGGRLITFDMYPPDTIPRWAQFQ